MDDVDRLAKVEASISELRRDRDDLKLSMQEVVTGLAYCTAQLAVITGKDAVCLFLEAERQVAQLKAMRQVHEAKYAEAPMYNDDGSLKT